MHFIRKMRKGQDEVSLKFCSDRYWWPGVVGSRSPSLSFSDPELLSNRPKHTMYSEKLLRKSPTFAGTQTFEFETSFRQHHKKYRGVILPFGAQIMYHQSISMEVKFCEVLVSCITRKPFFKKALFKLD